MFSIFRQIFQCLLPVSSCKYVYALPLAHDYLNLFENGFNLELQMFRQVMSNVMKRQRYKLRNYSALLEGSYQ